MILGVATTTVAAIACSHGWDSYDPRLGTASASGAGGGSEQSSTTTVGASTGTTSSVAASSGGAGVGGADSGPPTYPEIILADAPLAYWRFGEAHGQTIADAVGQHSGAASRSGLTYGVPGIVEGDTAIAFDGDQGRILVADAWDFEGQSPYSFEVWIKLTPNDSSFSRILAKEQSGNPRQGYIFIASDRGDAGLPSIAMERWVDGDKVLHNVFTGAIDSTKWTHVVARYDGALSEIFINGVSVISNAPSVDAGLVPNTGVLTLGAGNAGGSPFSGTMDELAIYGRALSNTEIERHYKAGSAGQ